MRMLYPYKTGGIRSPRIAGGGGRKAGARAVLTCRGPPIAAKAKFRMKVRSAGMLATRMACVCLPGATDAKRHIKERSTLCCDALPLQSRGGGIRSPKIAVSQDRHKAHARTFSRRGEIIGARNSARSNKIRAERNGWRWVSGVRSKRQNVR